MTMLTNLIRAGRWSDLPSERWVRPTLWIIAAVILVGTSGAYLHAASVSVGWWDMWYAFWEWLYTL
jgi:hypothetical protein